MPHIFISYAKRDTRKLAEALYQLLVTIPGVTTWMDMSLEADASWAYQIQQEIDRADYVIVLLSPDVNRPITESQRRSFVLNEIDYAQQDNKPILPVMAQMTKMPVQIAGIQYIDLRGSPNDPTLVVERVCRRFDLLTPTERMQRDAQEQLQRERDAQARQEEERVAAEKAERERLAEQKAEQERITGHIVRIPSHQLLPAPFAWIDIPGKGYSIAKYPITNAQFAKFIEAGGYKQQKWWTQVGWQQRQKDGWTEPRFWQDSKYSKWNDAKHPVIGVSWYEVVAFCLWLSEVTGENIMLPTEDQWQYAVQGDDLRTYPWGNEWDGNKCNNSVRPCSSGMVTSVRKYEGIGDSPFGVVDMAGNLREWCTHKALKSFDFYDNGKIITLCGAHWQLEEPYLFGCANRPNKRAIKWLHLLDWGIRMVCSK